MLVWRTLLHLRGRGAAVIEQAEAQANTQKMCEGERQAAAAQVALGESTSATDQQVDLSTLIC